MITLDVYYRRPESSGLARFRRAFPDRDAARRYVEDQGWEFVRARKAPDLRSAFPSGVR